MKVILAIAATCVLLTGCASTSREYAQARTKTDMAYVSKVEAQARAHGIGVIWVHPPRRQAVASKE